MRCTAESSARNLLLGAVGGVVGVFAMDTYFKLMKKRATTPRGRRNDGASREPHALDDISVAGIKKKGTEPATAALGRLGYHAATGHDPALKTKKRLSTGIHWGYGIAAGGLYGWLRGTGGKALDVPAGIGYGTALWLFGDEVLVPLLGLAAGPTAHPTADHLKALGAHLVYGAATSATTQALHRVA